MPLPPRPELSWDGATPRSTAFDDIYFSARGGAAETETVFLGGCGLPGAWAGRRRFAIAELGFGTGLNALVTWRAWAQARQHLTAPGATLHFLSVEAAPLDAADAARALASYPDLSSYADRLLARWPVRAFGPQRLWFDEDGFALTLWIGAARDALTSMQGPVDAWFLDGFAPARNPDMWTADLFARMRALSAPGARAATYSASGAVRSGLAAAGFAVERLPGFANKRHRVTARLVGAPPAAPHTLYPRAPASEKSVAIIGAGVAGASLAAALAHRGVSARLYEAAGPAAGASGNPRALIMPRLDRGAGPAARFFLAAYLYALDFWRERGLLEPVGVRERAAPLADPPLPETLLQDGPPGEILHPVAGTVPAADAVRALIGPAMIERAHVHALRRDGEGWALLDAAGEALGRAGAVAIAAGASLAALEETRWLPLALRRGEAAWGAVEGGGPGRALADGAYLAPHGDGVIFGATFEAWDTPEPGPPRAASMEANLANLAQLDPDLAARLALASLQARAGVRATASDRIPIMGLCPDAPAFRERFADLAFGRPPDLSAPAPAHEGLYVLGGLGARGFLTAPILSEALACEILDEPPPLDPEVLAALHPARFLVRSLKRRQV